MFIQKTTQLKLLKRIGYNQMTKKEIKKFYLSLIDNPDAIWCKEESNDHLLLHCRCNNIKIKAYFNYQLIFTYHGPDSKYDNISDTVTYNDIGISKFRLLFPYFGIKDRILRRIKKDIRNKKSIVSTKLLNSVSSIIAKDKFLNRDTKLNQLLQ